MVLYIGLVLGVTLKVRNFPQFLFLTFVFAITNAGGLRCANYVPRGIFVHDV